MGDCSGGRGARGPTGAGSLAATAASTQSANAAAFRRRGPDDETCDLAYSNRPLHMIEEGCDAGIVAGEITDESVVARSLGQIKRYVVASPTLVQARKPARTPGALQSWPWIALSGTQFGNAKEIVLHAPKQAEHKLAIQPVMTSEGVTSMREAVRMGLGVAVLPDWLVREDIVAGRVVRVLPQWQSRELPAHIVYPAQRTLPVRVRRFVDFAMSYMTSILKPKV